MFEISLDVREDDLLVYDRRLLNLLLSDKTTKRNIIWATDDYSSLGEQYAEKAEIQPDSVTGDHARLILPRIAKSIEEQTNRTRGKAEVFTPCWVCNAQNNLIDEQWFGRKDVFNTEDNQSWIPTAEPVAFYGKKTWKKYVDARRMEVSCGEAPYLVSRYDTTTGEIIPIPRRIGLLDRKLRVVNENTESEEDWYIWTLRAFQSVYGYEFQGDSLLLARENLLAAFIEYYQHRWGKDPGKRQVLKIANVIAWNLWQMDGLKCVVPFSCREEIHEILSLIDIESSKTVIPCPGCESGDVRRHNGIYCKVYDWRKNRSLLFVSMMKGATV